MFHGKEKPYQNNNTIMEKRKWILACVVMLSMAAQAQWRVGATIGADYNVFTMDKQYESDWQNNGRWGVTMGVTGQYNFNDWLGIRADLNWTQKNYRRNRDRVAIDYRYYNNYLQLPVMASLSMGGQKLRGFVNLGFYGGYWLSSNREGVEFSSFSDRVYSFSEKIEFDNERDQRWDFGLVGGVGLEYRFATHWAAQMEVRYYYSFTSVQKQYMLIKDYRYNGTTAIQAGMNYIF